MQQIIKKKICLLGSYGVGKTSLVKRYVYNIFDEKYLSTIGVQISKKSISFNSEINVDLFIWDIANIEKFDNVVKNYLNGAHGAILITDLTRINTIEQSIEQADLFLNLNPNAKIVFAGNKIDLTETENFNSDKYLRNFKKFKTEFYFTSAKTGEKVEELFINIAEKLI